MESSQHNNLGNAADQFLTTKATALQDWKSICSCSDPGTQVACIDCSSYRMLVKRMQGAIAPDSVESNLPKLISPPNNEALDANRQCCCDLYSLGYSVNDIRWMIGVKNLKMIRRWLREAKLIGGCRDYSSSDKRRCLELYQSGLSPQQVEAETGIPGDVISDWAAIANVRRPKASRNYSDQDCQKCLDLYMSGKSHQKVSHLTGISVDQVKQWVKESGLKRERVYTGGRPKAYSNEFRADCLKLLAQGQTATQVAMAKGLSADTIRQWKKQATEQSPSEHKSIEPVKTYHNQQKPDDAKQPAAGTNSQISSTSQQPHVQQLNLFKL